MVAVVILLLCVSPSMRILTNIFKSQQEIVRENQKGHIVHLLHAKFVEMLYKRMIEFDVNGEGKDIAVNDPELLEKLKKLKISYKAEFSVEKRRKIKGGDRYLCKLEIDVIDLLAKTHLDCNSICKENKYKTWLCIDIGEEEKKGNQIVDEEESGSDDEDMEETEDEDEDDDDEDDDESMTQFPMKKRASQIAEGMSR